PAERRSHVVELHCRAVEPGLLVGAARESACRPRELDEEPGMAAARIGCDLELVESLLRVLANRLEHPKAHSLSLDKGVRDQRLERRAGRATNRVGGLGRPAATENRERSEGGRLLRAEE